MRRPLSSFAPAALIALALAATGCQQLFTTSLAAWAERPELPVPSSLSKSEAVEYAEKVVDNRNTSLAQALLPAMADLLADNPGDPVVLASAAATASVATGLDQAIADVFRNEPDFLQAFIDGTFSGSQIDALAVALTSVDVTSDAMGIFSSLEAATDMSALENAGLTAGTFAIAAAAIIISAVPDGSMNLLVDGVNDAADDALFALPEVSAALTDAKALIDKAALYWTSDTMLTAIVDLIPQL